MTDRAVMQQALEALREFGYHGSSPRWERTANALKTALEQPEPDLIPQDKLFVCGQMGANITRVTAQPEQVDCPRCGHVCSQRPWQGLTEWEREAIAHACGAMGSEWLVLVEAVEKALKEKNR